MRSYRVTEYKKKEKNYGIKQKRDKKKLVACNILNQTANLLQTKQKVHAEYANITTAWKCNGIKLSLWTCV